MTVSMLKCQTQLMLVWVIGGLLLLFVAWLQIAFGHYGDHGSDVIEWFLPTVTPTLSLVGGVWANNALRKPKSTQKVDKGTYRIVLIISIFYLTFIASVFAIQPMIARPPIDIVRDSSLILGPLQGIVCAFIGIFFTQKKE